MNFDRMRSLLLAKAIRGELVPQFAKEGAVDQIGAVPEQVPFAIPEKWKWVRLSDLVLKHLGGGTPSKLNASFWNGDIPWASVKDLKGTVLSTTQDSITEEGLNNSSSNLIPAGTVIVCTRMGLGKVAINTVPVAINQDLRALFLSEKIDKNYFLHFYSGMNIEGAGTTVKGIKLTELLNLPISLPPVEEQIRIVAKLEEAFAEIARAEKAYEELQTLAGVLRGQILQEAIKGKLVPQRAEEGVVEQIGSALDEVPFTIPSSWKWQKVIEIAKVMGGKRVPAGAKLIEENTGYPYIRVSDMKNGGVDTSGLLYLTEDCREKIKRYTISCNDIYVTVAGTIGRVGIIPEELDGANLTENADKIVLNTDSVIRDWLLLVLSSKYCQTVFRERKTKVGQPKLAIKRIESIMIPVPPVEEQRLVVSKVEELMIQVDALLS